MYAAASAQPGRVGLVGSFGRPGRALVAIPARNEAEALPDCLAALAAQQGAILDGVVVCLNNCTDGSADVLDRLAPGLPFPLQVVTVSLPAHLACAGRARRLAMDRAATLVGPAGVVLTTDADSQAPPGWLAANLAAIAAGADAVAGRARIEPIGARLIPAHLHAIDARECAYAALLDEIRALLDPDPADPWPRHDEHCGASIAVTVAAYRRTGGMPVVPLGEDRAFFQRLRQADARIRHAPDVHVVVSARLHGRAGGGMADTMRRRIAQVDPFLDARLEPAWVAAHRAALCGRLRRMWTAGAADAQALARIALRLGLPPRNLAERFGIGPGDSGTGRWRPNRRSAGPGRRLGVVVDDATARAMEQNGRLVGHGRDAVAGATPAPSFGAAWAWVERHSPTLRPRPVALDDLQAETARAMRIRDRLRRAADPADTPSAAAAA